MRCSVTTGDGRIGEERRGSHGGRWEEGGREGGGGGLNGGDGTISRISSINTSTLLDHRTEIKPEIARELVVLICQFCVNGMLG